MRLLIDSDAFCKLAIGGVFEDSIRMLGADLPDCGRLAALPHMLRRGKLRKTFGSDACDEVSRWTAAVPVMSAPSPVWLDKLTPIDAVDPGEAQIFAAAAESGLIVVSGDKRALLAVKAIAGFAEALSGRIVVLEAILIALCDRMGSCEVRKRVQPLIALDRVVQVCFSTGNEDPREGLLSYYRDLATEVSPLILWNPAPGRQA
jgi:hypothetical protein